MEAKEIRQKGKKVKSWERPDGPWYTDFWEIWVIGDKFYQIESHIGNHSGCIGSVFDLVKEIAPIEIPTHLGITIAWSGGKAWIEDQLQGTPEEIADWYNTKRIDKKDYHFNLDLKIVKL